MAGYGMSETGFRLKRLQEIKEEIEVALRTEFGTSINLLPESVFGQIVATFADREASLWEHVQAVYSSRDPNQAEGLSLDRVASMVGITRLPAVATTVTATLVGTAGTIIPAGSRAGVTGTSFAFELAEDATIGIGGTITAVMTCTEAGAVPCLTGTLTTILTPVFGWDSVTNTVDGELGRAEETDADFRVRRLEYLSTGAAGTLNAIRSTLMSRVTDQCVVMENDTDSVNGYGMPAHSIWVIVHGSGIDSQDVGDALFDLKAAGIATHGDISVTVEDSEGVTHAVKFSEATPVRCYLHVVALVDDTFDIGEKQEQIVTVDLAEADDYTITINGVDITYTAGGGDTVTTIAQGLVALVNGDDGFWRNVEATHVADGVFTLTARYEGNAFIATTEDERITIDDPSTENSGDQEAIRLAILALWETLQTVGDEVYLSRYYRAVHDVSGVLTSAITQQTDLTLPLTWLTTTIEVDVSEVASLESYDIIVEVST